MNKKSILIDIGGTTIIGGLHNSSKKNEIQKIIEFKTGEYTYKNVIKKIDSIINHFKNEEINYILISLNGLINKGFVYLSRIMGGDVGVDLAKELSKKYSIETKIENDVNCMALGYKLLRKKENNNFVLLNLGTGIRVSCIFENKLFRGFNGFLGEIRDSIYVKELEKNININELVCGRGISNIYKNLYGKTLTAKEIYSLSKKNDSKSQKTINIFIKYLIYILLRTSYSYNPEEIIIDGSLKILFSEKLDSIIKEYEKKCEKHFVSNIIISDFEYTNLYGTLLI